MPKSSFFTGQPVFAQLLALIPAEFIRSLTRQYGSDRYCKSFKTRDHLVTMLYACFHRCNSLREVVTGIAANYNKLTHLGLQYAPCRSTFADANERREAIFFEKLYHRLYQYYYRRLADSSRGKSIEKRLFILDATTVSLFTDIMKGAGCPAADGRKKGGAKAHVLLDAHHDVPALIRLTAASRNDRVFMEDIALPRGSILVFDKGYHKFSQWDKWTSAGINWVTRLIDTEVIEVLVDKPVTIAQKQAGTQADQTIILGRGTNKSTQRIKVRKVTHYDAATNKTFHFLTNNFKFSPLTIADIYKDRWQIELFFKRFKQHNPVRLFLGNNENAIKIQLWCSFIADLLIKIIKDRIKRKWSFANLSAVVRLNLMNYLHLNRFLNDPDRLTYYPKHPPSADLFTQRGALF